MSKYGNLICPFFLLGLFGILLMSLGSPLYHILPIYIGYIGIVLVPIGFIGGVFMIMGHVISINGWWTNNKKEGET